LEKTKNLLLETLDFLFQVIPLSYLLIEFLLIVLTFSADSRITESKEKKQKFCI